MSKAVFLDLGGVIYNISWSGALDHVGITDRDQQKSLIRSFADWEPHHKYERGEITCENFFVQMREFVQSEISVSLEIEDIQACWSRVIAGLLPDVEKIFEEFSNRVPIYALSNTNAWHIEKDLENDSTLKRFDHVFTSYELGARKPELEIYRRALDRFLVKPSNALFVDDNSANIDAAREVGMHAHLSVNDAQKTLGVIREFCSL